MNKLKTIIFFGTFLLISQCQAQYNQNIPIDSSKLPKSTMSFLLGNKFIESISPKLMKYESSSFEYNKFQKNTKAGKLTFVAGALVGTIFTITNLDNPKKAATIFLGSSACIGGIVAILLSSAKKHLLKSIKNYNIEVIK